MKKGKLTPLLLSPDSVQGMQVWAIIILSDCLFMMMFLTMIPAEVAAAQVVFLGHERYSFPRFAHKDRGRCTRRRRHDAD